MFLVMAVAIGRAHRSSLRFGIFNGEGGRVTFLDFFRDLGNKWLLSFSSILLIITDKIICTYYRTLRFRSLFSILVYFMFEISKKIEKAKLIHIR